MGCTFIWAASPCTVTVGGYGTISTWSTTDKEYWIGDTGTNYVTSAGCARVEFVDEDNCQKGNGDNLVKYGASSGNLPWDLWHGNPLSSLRWFHTCIILNILCSVLCLHLLSLVETVE